MFDKIASANTKGIQVNVQTEFHAFHSEENHFVFTYQISIKNTSAVTVQLLRRHWVIFDSNGEYKNVEGEGVVGLQPVIQTGQTHHYTSGCVLKTDMGKMWGSYLMLNVDEKKLFEVKIPEFVMIDPLRFN